MLRRYAARVCRSTCRFNSTVARQSRRIGGFVAASAAAATTAIAIGCINGAAICTPDEIKGPEGERPHGTNGKHHPKTEEERETIIEGINYNRLIKFLDPEQRESMIRVLRKIEVKAGTTIIKEGDPTTDFYIVASGECDHLMPTPATGGKTTPAVRRTLRAGESFGEQGLLMGTTRSAMVRARTDMTLWVCDLETFRRCVLPSERLRNIFFKHTTASADCPAMLTEEKFMAALNDISEGTISVETSRYLFKIFDHNKTNNISFEDFALFDLLISKPDCEIDIAFLLFDKKRDGYITKDEVMVTLRNMGRHLHKINFDCDLMVRFFGADGQNKLRFGDFSQFFLALQEEIPQQMFQMFDPDNRGYILPEQFVEMLDYVGTYRMTPGVYKRLRDSKCLRCRQQVVTYPEVLALNSCLNRLPGIGLMIERIGGRNKINKELFQKKAATFMTNDISPLEVEVIFHLFDTDHDDCISVRDFLCVSGCEPSAVLAFPWLDSPPLFSVENGKTALVSISAGMVGAATMVPLDLVKTRLQNQRVIDGKGRLYSTTLNCFVKTVRAEGFFALAKGLFPSILVTVPEKCIKIAVNDVLRRWFEDERRGPGYLPIEVLSGCIAGASPVMFTTPLEAVKIHLQLQNELVPKGSGVRPKGMFQIARELGFSGMYRGTAACCMRDILFTGTYFPAYAILKDLLAGSDGHNHPLAVILAATVAGIPAAALATPFDVVKTRMQAPPPGQKPYHCVTECLRSIVAQEGIGALLKGTTARILRTMPQFGATLMVYEYIRDNFAPEIKRTPLTNVPMTTSDYDDFRGLFADNVNRVVNQLKVFDINFEDKPEEKKDQRRGLFGIRRR